MATGLRGKEEEWRDNCARYCCSTAGLQCAYIYKSNY